MKTRKATRDKLSRHVQSESEQSDNGETSLVNDDSQPICFWIEYPITCDTCSVCHDPLPSLNLKIREHALDVHNIQTIKYRCKGCGSEYASIGSIKSHYPACIRKQTTSNIPPVNTQNQVHRTNDAPNNNTHTPTLPPLQCIECNNQSISFIAKDRKGLSTHMRLKHPAAYEDSKKVANIRIAWSKDEDTILANLEVSLKSAKKGQILDRLYNEWNKLATQSCANHRTKDAIRSRRRQPEYKNILANVQSNRDNQNRTIDMPSDPNSSDNESDSESDSPMDVQVTTGAHNAIHEFLTEIAQLNHVHISDHMIEAINALLKPNGDHDPVQQTMAAIEHSLMTIRRNNAANTHINRSKTATKIKPSRSVPRIEKEKKHAYYQRLYKFNKSRLVDELVDGVAPNIDPPPIHLTVKHYEQIWSKSTPDIHPVEIKPKNTENTEILTSPITKKDILWAIKRTKRDSAVGLDHVTLHEAKLLAEKDLLVAFNIWLSCKKIPLQLKLNRTTLIPKGNKDLDKVSNWRPITISSILLRLFNKIVGYRMSRFFKIDKRQLGFQPINGCSMNILWLHNLLKHARLYKRDLYVCLIDVAKAFDSVPHDSIFRALTRHRAPPAFIDLVRDQYHDSATSIAYKNLSSRKIKFLRGVKQGDSLSPLLFNLVIDELMALVKDRFGYSIENIGSSNIKCFADDICLASGSQIGLNHLINEASAFLEKRGLLINAKKCVTIGLAKAYKGKKSKIITESVFTIKGTPIPMLGHIENYTRYLGVNFTSVGSVHAHTTRSEIENVLDKIKSISLKPQQKIDLLRSYVIPRFIYQLINLENYPTFLKQIDLLIRRTIRSILHLPISLSNEFFYLPVREGGLQMPVMRDIVGLAKVRIYKKIMKSDDVLLKHLVETRGFHIIHRFINDLELDTTFENDNTNEKKKQLAKERRISFSNKVHGYGAEVFATCPLSNTWLYGNTKTLTGRNYINGIKLRTNTLESKVTLTRGLDVDKTCRACNSQQESLMHIIQFCPSTKGLRYQRHHSICSRVVKKLRERGFTVFSEKAFPRPDLPTLRPDIIAIRDDQAYILDVQCTYETSNASFINAYNLKVQKYAPLAEIVKETYKCISVTTHGLIIGSRGSYYYNQLYIWYSLGFTTFDLKYMSLNAMENSLRIVSSFHKCVCSSYDSGIINNFGQGQDIVDT